MLKLALGCGQRNYGLDWEHIDGDKSFVHLSSNDIINLPYSDNSVDIIYACHVLNYFDRNEVLPILSQWHKKLNKNGILRLAVPDFEAMAKLYINQNYDLGNFLGPLYGRIKMNEKYIYHKTAYDFYDLKYLLELVGFRNVKRYDCFKTDHAKIDDQSFAFIEKMDFENGTLISLNLECNK